MKKRTPDRAFVVPEAPDLSARRAQIAQEQFPLGDAVAVVEEHQHNRLVQDVTHIDSS